MKPILIAALLAMGQPVAAQHAHGDMAAAHPEAVDWSHAPRLLSAGRGRSAQPLQLLDIHADQVSVFAPGGPAAQRTRQVPVRSGRVDITPAAPMMGNYHWVQAREASAGMVHVAATAVYFANPGPAPTALLAEPRSELEIVPSPLPREHGHYRESERWHFLVRWQGAPLAGQAVTLETAHGSRSRAVSDAEGRITVLFPRDFYPEAAGAGGHGRSGAPFVLWTERHEAGLHYLSSFSDQYHPDPDRSRSLAWGAGFGLFGMALAVPLLRRKEARHD
jgi:hypothetical protein